MTILQQQCVSPHIARKLSVKQLEVWSSTGALQRDELKKIIKEITRTLHKSSSPAKALSTSIKKLDGLFSRPEVRGKVYQLNNRHIHFRLAFPAVSEDGLAFRLLYGEINSRTGAVRFDLTSPIQMSMHALQRLYERLGDPSGEAVLDEIYSCIGQVISWHIGATEIQAKCWPLISQNGFFIGTSLTDSLTTILITWIKSGNMSKKWGLPLKNLERLREHRPDRLDDPEFVKEFIRSFPWMMHEHVPGEDLISLAWEQRDNKEVEVLAKSSEQNGKLDSETIDYLKLPKLSINYVPGFNYKKTPPIFKINTIHSGVVVQRRNDQSLIVGLKNGWVGRVPSQSIKRGYELISQYSSYDVGDYIEVVVRKINHFQEENAFSISLDPKEISNASWVAMEKEYPIGSFHKVILSGKNRAYFFAQLDNGIRGLIPLTEVRAYLLHPEFHGSTFIGLNLDVIVTGYRSEEKCFLLSICNIDKLTSINLRIDTNLVGTLAAGRCIRKTQNFCEIELKQYVYGRLHKFNNWGRELPEVGEQLTVVVFGQHESNLLLAGEHPNSFSKCFYLKPLTDEAWDSFIKNNAVGDIIEVQNLSWQDNFHSFAVVNIDGILCTLPQTEVSWASVIVQDMKFQLSPGDLFLTKIIKIIQSKKRIIVSKKALIDNPIDEFVTQIKIGDFVEGLVVKVMFYGYFLKINPYGVQALLHRSKIPGGKIFKEGDLINAVIDNVDQLTKRISVKI